MMGPGGSLRAADLFRYPKACWPPPVILRHLQEERVGNARCGHHALLRSVTGSAPCEGLFMMPWPVAGTGVETWRGTPGRGCAELRHRRSIRWERTSP